MRHCYWGLLIFGLLGWCSTSRANAEIVIIVSVNNPIHTLSVAQAEKIFLRKDSKFPNGTEAVAVDGPTGKERDEFYQGVAHKNAFQLRAYWARQMFTGGEKPPMTVSSAEELVELIGNDSNKIGYCERSLVNSSVKVVLTVP